MTVTDATLGATLRAWRDRLPPSAVGLPPGRARRTAGLRREELAELAGLSVDYLVRLEQGRATAPSAQVVAALSRALQLTPAERDHLYRLANLVAPGTGTIADHIPPGVARLLVRFGDAAVAVFAADWQLLWWNDPWAALLGDPSPTPPKLRNFARDRFPITDTARNLSHWPVVSVNDDDTDAAVVSDLRWASARFPADVRLAASRPTGRTASHRAPGGRLHRRRVRRADRRRPRPEDRHPQCGTGQRGRDQAAPGAGRGLHAPECGGDG